MERKKKNLNQKLKIVFFILLIILILVMVGSVIYYRSTLKDTGPSDIAEALRYYDCTLIKVEKSKEEGFLKDIYANLRHPPIEEYGFSQKDEYENIIKDVSNAVQDNYRLIDEEKGLTIRVIYSSEQRTSTYSINGDHNYFNNQLALLQKSKLEIKLTDLKVNSKVLQSIINANWVRRNVNDLGTVDSTALNYDCYFDEGYKLKTHGVNVFNIVFTHQYNGSVVNNISTNTSNYAIKNTLGEPAFNLNNGLIIGYKSNDIYAFFSDGEISIYKVNSLEEDKNNKFANLVEELNKSGEVKKFYNELVQLYPNPETASEEGDEISATYPEYGFSVTFGKFTNTIKIYRNFLGKVTPDEPVENLIDGQVPINISTQFDEDLIFETEKIRRAKDIGYRKAYKSEKKDLNICVETDEYLVLGFKGKNVVNFFSIDKTNLDSSITYISGMKVLKYNETSFIYSIPNKGIYYYDAKNAKNTTLAEGEETFSLESIENNTIKYDNGKTLNIG